MAMQPFAFQQALKNKTKKEILAGKLLEMIFCGLLRDGDELPVSDNWGSCLGSVEKPCGVQWA